ncbi:LysR family transcriptional regulator [Promicromonospora sp. NPDC059942]|uniref:LysR family transcriptional regulator n=1 Tax=Promicromonospora sp. NPDC059942 TaxID=3347009 RepID=UPI00365BE0CE
MQLDMNLLAALDVLLEEGSVTGAADRLHLSQPAMSRTLARIRRSTGDQILVRSGRTMVPTPYALNVRDQVHQLAEQVRAVLTPHHDLELDRLATTFTYRCHDAITSALAPRLIRRVSAEAPGVRIRFLAESSTDMDGLRTGRTDIEIGSSAGTTADMESQTVTASRFVVVMRNGHPLAGMPMTAEQYAAATHINVSRRGRFADPVDDALDELGLARTVIATAPTSTAALRIVQTTDSLTAVPERICQQDIDALGLATAPLPLSIPALPLTISWHTRNSGDPAHRWLRETTVSELTGIGTTTTGTASS